MRRMKIRMELTEASVTEDITPFERERLREALEEEVRGQLPTDRRLLRVVDWDPGGGHAVENTPGMRSIQGRVRDGTVRLGRLALLFRMPDRLASELMAVHGFARRLVVVNLTDQLALRFTEGSRQVPVVGDRY